MNGNVPNHRPPMPRQTYQRIGSLSGLAIGYLAMRACGLSGLVYLFLFCVTGCVAGAMLAERFHAKHRNED